MAHDTTTLEEFGEKSRARGNVTKSINEHRSRLSHSVTSHEQINQRNQHLYPCVAVRVRCACAPLQTHPPNISDFQGSCPQPKGAKKERSPRACARGGALPSPHRQARWGLAQGIHGPPSSPPSLLSLSPSLSSTPYSSSSATSHASSSPFAHCSIATAASQ